MYQWILVTTVLQQMFSDSSCQDFDFQAELVPGKCYYHPPNGGSLTVNLVGHIGISVELFPLSANCSQIPIINRFFPVGQCLPIPGTDESVKFEILSR